MSKWIDPKSKEQLAEERRQSKMIDAAMKLEKKQLRVMRSKEKTLLLLGPKNVGKTTVMKQLSIIKQLAFSEMEKNCFLSIVAENIIRGIISVIQNAHKQGHDKELLSRVEGLSIINDFFYSEKFSVMKSPKDIPPSVLTVIKSIWKEKQVKRSAENNSQLDRYFYFLENIDRCTAPEFTLTHEDILRCRKETKSAYSKTFSFGENRKLHAIDVGGALYSRHTWFSFFDNVDMIVYIVDVGAFDLNCEDYAWLNSMLESLQIFEKIASNELIQDIPIMVFFNKVDILKRKLKLWAKKGQKHQTQRLFPDYNSTDNLKGILYFFRLKFLKAAKGRKGSVSFSVTFALDTQLTSQVVQGIEKALLTESAKMDIFTEAISLA